MVHSVAASATHDDLEMSVAMMVRVGFCRSPSFSPDGRRIAFISNLNGVPQVWTVETEGGWPTLVTALDDPVTALSWSPDGEWLAFSLAPGGGENRQVYIVRPDGSGLRRLTDGGRENNFLGVWTDDGAALAIASNRRSASSTDAYLCDIASGEMRLVTENEGIGGFLDVSLDKRHALLYRMVNRSDDDLFLVTLATGEQVLVTPHEGPGSFDGKFSPDGRTIYLSSNKDRDLAAFALVRLDANDRPGPIEVLAARDDAELDGFTINEQGTRAALVWNVAGLSELTFLDLDTLKLAPAPALPAEVIDPFASRAADATRVDLAFSKDGRQLAMTLSGAAAPRNIWCLI